MKKSIYIHYTMDSVKPQLEPLLTNMVEIEWRSKADQLALTDEISIRHYLTGVGLAAVRPLIASARPPPQTAFEFAA